MEKSIEQTKADWVTHGKVARLQYSLHGEKDEGRRKQLEALLKEQLELVARRASEPA